ncbi:MAG: BRCT domain-containing protein, partial [Thermodesulfobacteriota bacterium]
AAVSDKLKGQVFVFTGLLESMTRDEAERLVAQHGGRATSSVTKKTNYVVAGTDPGSKYDKAVSLGIQVLNEDEFRKMIGEL